MLGKFHKRFAETSARCIYIVSHPLHALLLDLSTAMLVRLEDAFTQTQSQPDGSTKQD